MSGSYHFNYCSFEIYFTVRKFGVSGSILLSQDCFGYFCVCVVPYKLSKFVFLIYKKYCQDFDGDNIESPDDFE